MEGGKKYPNIVFILSDALRARDISCYGYEKLTTPNIDNLAKNGVLFENAYACINETDMCLTTIFSGLFPPTHGVVRPGEDYWDLNWQKIRRNNIRFLPEFLKEMGYYTIAIDWLGRWHRNGYDVYSERLSRAPILNNIQNYLRKFPNIYKVIHSIYKKTIVRTPHGIPTGPIVENAGTLTKKAIEVINDNNQMKFFLFIHYWDTHVPFNPPKSYFQNFHDGNGKTNLSKYLEKIQNPDYKKYMYSWTKGLNYVEDVKAKYDASIAYVDYNIGVLIDFLKKKGIFDDTIFIVTADHGQSFIEHDVFLHSTLHEEIMHIPLIIKSPMLPKNKRIKGLIQHVDIVPTILDLLGSNINRNFDGKSLIPLIQKDEQIRKRVYGYTLDKKMAMDDKFKLIIENSEKILYNLEDDPSESMNVMNKFPNVVQKLEKDLLEWFEYCKRKQIKMSLKRKIKNLKIGGKRRQ